MVKSNDVYHSLIHRIVLSFKVFTVCPTYHGTLGLMEDIILDTVNTTRSSLVLGIGLTWLLLRYLFAYFFHGAYNRLAKSRLLATYLRTDAQ
jgi:succinate dehydrogenase hydrophobic anchor subunit